MRVCGKITDLCLSVRGINCRWESQLLNSLKSSDCQGCISGDRRKKVWKRATFHVCKRENFETWPMKTRLVCLTSKECPLKAFLDTCSLFQVRFLLTCNSPYPALSILFFFFFCIHISECNLGWKGTQAIRTHGPSNNKEWYLTLGAASPSYSLNRSSYKVECIRN